MHKASPDAANAQRPVAWAICPYTQGLNYCGQVEAQNTCNIWLSLGIKPTWLAPGNDW